MSITSTVFASAVMYVSVVRIRVSFSFERFTARLVEFNPSGIETTVWYTLTTTIVTTERRTPTQMTLTLPMLASWLCHPSRPTFVLFDTIDTLKQTAVIFHFNYFDWFLHGPVMLLASFSLCQLLNHRFCQFFANNSKNAKLLQAINMTPQHVDGAPWTLC